MLNFKWSYFIDLSTILPEEIEELKKNRYGVPSKPLYIRVSHSFVMADDKEKKFSRDLMGKTVVSKTGKRFGEVGDIVFEVRSGELIHLVLRNPTPYCEKLELEKDKEGNILIPFSAVLATGDYMVVSEEDII